MYNIFNYASDSFQLHHSQAQLDTPDRCLFISCRQLNPNSAQTQGLYSLDRAPDLGIYCGVPGPPCLSKIVTDRLGFIVC